jgi:hypothetical protein
MTNSGGLAGSFEHYLGILKSVHASDDLNMFIEQTKGSVGGDTHHLMSDIQQNFKD